MKGMANIQLIQIGTPEYRQLSIAMVAAGLATFALLYNVQPLLPVFSDAFGVSAENASLTVSIATGPMAVGILVAGWLADAIGRRMVMMISLIAATVFGWMAAVAPTWESLLALRLLCGIALAGVPAVAIAYVAEEVEKDAISPAVGLYIAGTAMGGMIGRVGAAALVDWSDWRVALGVMGAFSALATTAFCVMAPASRSFVPKRTNLAGFLGGYRRALSDWVQVCLCLCGALLMGAFVAVYNYTPYRLASPPYALSFAAIGAIAFFYALGSFSSAYFGGLAGRLGVRPTFWIPVVVCLAGTILTVASPLWVNIAAIGIVTIGFFGAHSVASSWVSRRAFDNKTHASALYLFGYYAGSSVLGSVGGFAWTHGGWNGVAAFAGVLCLGVLVLALLLGRSKPLADPRQPDQGEQIPG
jgi:YNFM family putative membrane transporter